MKFLIQHNLMGEQWLTDVKTALIGLPHEFVGVIPFSKEITSNEELLGVDYIPYGSTLFTNLALERGWKGLHFDPSIDYVNAICSRDDMLNTDYWLNIHSAINFLKSRPATEQWFVRPAADLKQFSGQCIDAGECAAWLKDAVNCDSTGSYGLKDNTLIILAKPKKILAEWRWFIVDGKIISGAMYRAHGRLIRVNCDYDPADQYLRDEAQELADKWLPNPCCVMDTALIDHGPIKPLIIEFNCINSSGFYGHDITEIFRSLYNYHTIK